MTRRSHAREVVLQLLFQRDFNTPLERGPLEQLCRDWLRDPPLLPFALGLYDGVVTHSDAIDQCLSAAAENWRLPRMNPVDRNVLRLGAFELLHCPETPPRVAIDEAIELARRYGTADSPSFVNGILDRLLRERVTT